MDNKKFDTLLNRLEGYVIGAENSVPKNPQQQLAKLETLIQRLEAAAAGGGTIPAGTGQAVAAIKSTAAPAIGGGGGGDYAKKYQEACFGKVDALLAVTKEQDNEGLVAAVNLYLDILKSQAAVFNTMAACSKPADLTFLITIVKEKKNEMIALEKKNRKLMNHFRCLQDSVNMYAWFQIPTGDKEVYDAQLADFYGAIDFVGTKLQSNDAEKKWYRAFRSVQQDFYEFIKSNSPDIQNWTGSNADAEAQYKGLLGGTISAAPPKAAEPAQIVEKNEEKPAPVKKAAPVKAVKPPVKKFNYPTWEISDYKNDTIVFTEDEVQADFTFNFYNCEKLKVVIPGKIKNFMLMRCKRFKLELPSCISMGEVLKCEGVQLHVAETVPQISVELCNQVEVFATKESVDKIAIMTTASQSVSFKIPNPDFDETKEESDPIKTEVIPESFVSKLTNGKFETKAEEGGFD